MLEWLFNKSRPEVKGLWKMTMTFPGGYHEEYVVKQWKRVDKDMAEAVLRDGTTLTAINAKFKFEELDECEDK